MEMKTKNARQVNDLIRRLYFMHGGLRTTWYYNDAQHWRVNRRKVFKIFVGESAGVRSHELKVWNKVLKDMRTLDNTEWEIFETKPPKHGAYQNPMYVGIKKYETNNLYRG